MTVGCAEVGETLGRRDGSEVVGNNEGCDVMGHTEGGEVVGNNEGCESITDGCKVGPSGDCSNPKIGSMYSVTEYSAATGFEDHEGDTMFNEPPSPFHAQPYTAL
jgi:hypothetical protein